MLSFPIEGVTLAIDFSNKGETTLKMLENIDSVIIDAVVEFILQRCQNEKRNVSKKFFKF